MKRLLVPLSILLVLVFIIAGCGAKPTTPAAPVTNPPTAAPVTTAAPAKFPDKQVTIVCTVAPGGVGDILARTLLPFLEKKLGVPVVIDNRPGAGHVVGWDAAAQRPADGHTLLITGPLISVALNDINKLAKTPLLDYNWLAIFTHEIVPLHTHKTHPSIKTFDDLLKMKNVKLADSSYESGANPFNATIFKAFNIPFTFTPGYATQDLPVATAKGEQDCFSRGIQGLEGLGWLDEINTLSVNGPQRDRTRPDVPTIKELLEKHKITVEQGSPLWYIANTGSASYDMFIAAPPNTPQNLVAEWEKILKDIFNQPDFREAMLKVNTGFTADLVGVDVTTKIAKDTKEFFSLVDLAEITKLMKEGFKGN